MDHLFFFFFFIDTYPSSLFVFKFYFHKHCVQNIYFTLLKSSLFLFRTNLKSFEIFVSHFLVRICSNSSDEALEDTEPNQARSHRGRLDIRSEHTTMLNFRDNMNMFCSVKFSFHTYSRLQISSLRP